MPEIRGYKRNVTTALKENTVADRIGSRGCPCPSKCNRRTLRARSTHGTCCSRWAGETNWSLRANRADWPLRTGRPCWALRSLWTHRALRALRPKQSNVERRRAARLLIFFAVEQNERGRRRSGSRERDTMI